MNNITVIRSDDPLSFTGVNDWNYNCSLLINNRYLIFSDARITIYIFQRFQAESIRQSESKAPCLKADKPRGHAIYCNYWDLCLLSNNTIEKEPVYLIRKWNTLNILPSHNINNVQHYSFELKLHNFNKIGQRLGDPNAHQVTLILTEWSFTFSSEMSAVGWKILIIIIIIIIIIITII